MELEKSQDTNQKNNEKPAVDAKEQQRLDNLREAKREKTIQLKTQFLGLFKKVHIKTAVCEKMNLHPSTVNRWRKDDQEFNEAYCDIERTRNEEVEDRLFKQIKKDNITAIMFYLGRRNPDYKQKSEIQGSLTSEPIEKKITEDIKKRDEQIRNIEDTIADVRAALERAENSETESESESDTEQTADQEQEGENSAVQAQRSSAVVLEAQDAPKPDTQGSAAGTQ